MTGKKELVPALETNNTLLAVMPRTKSGLLTATKPRSKGPVCGALNGLPPLLPCTPTAIVMIKTLTITSAHLQYDLC